MPEPDTSRTPWLRFAIVGGLLVFTVVTLATNVLPARESHRRTRRMLQEQQEANRAAEQRIEELHDEARALTEDPWPVGRVIREELNRKDEDEIEVR